MSTPLRRPALLGIVASALWLSAYSPAAVAKAEKFRVDEAHSRIHFVSYTKLFDVQGNFARWTVDASIDVADLEQSSISFTVHPASVDTDNDTRDKHLRDQDFFWVEKHPVATFVSTKIVQKAPGKLEVTGNFTLRGVAKTITVPVTFEEVDRGKFISRRAHGQFRVDRFAYGITYDGGLLLPSIDKNVDIFFDINFLPPKPKGAPPPQ